MRKRDPMLVGIYYSIVFLIMLMMLSILYKSSTWFFTFKCSSYNVERILLFRFLCGCILKVGRFTQKQVLLLHYALTQNTQAGYFENN